MKHAVLALCVAVIGTSGVVGTGCVTTAALVKKQDVGLPLLIGAFVADVVVASLVAAQLEDASTGGAIATGVAVGGADLAVGCLIGACTSLKL